MTTPYVYRDQRGTSIQPGVLSRHCFSSGPYYDPERMGVGPIIGVDEHVVQPGAGFDWHAHRGVHIASWVLDGVLRHEDSHGEVRFVSPGALFVQSTGDGIRHTETNASDMDPLRFLQITVLGEDMPGVRTETLPARVGEVLVDVRDSVFVDFDFDLLLMVRGGCSIEGVERVATGAMLRGGGGNHLDGWQPGSVALLLRLEGDC